MSNSRNNSVGDVLGMRRYRLWHWLLTIVYGLFMVLSLPFAMRSLMMGPGEDVPEGLFFAMNLAIAAVPFTIGVCLVASWMYHRGGAQRAAFIPYAIPLLNIAIAMVLRALLG